MAYDFDETAPADNDYISDFPANERDARAAKKEAFEVDHELTDGYHDAVTLNEGADPDPPADRMAVYAKDSDGQPELFVQEEDDGSPGDVIQVTKGGYLHQVISTLGAAPEEERKMLAHLLLLNAKLIQGENAATGTYYDLLGLNASDECDVGDSDAGTVQLLRLKIADDVADPEQQFVVEYGDGDKKIFHEAFMGDGSGLDADLVDGYEATELLLSADATVAGRFFESTEVAISAGATSVQAHGLGGIPNLVTVALRCKTAQYGWTANDEVAVAQDCDQASGNGLSAGAETGNIVVQIGGAAAVFVHERTSGINRQLTNSSWRVVVRAWR